MDIEDEYKSFVIGKQRAKLKEISTKTGAKVILKDGEVHIILGNEEQRKQARVHIGAIVVGIFFLLVICETSLIASTCSRVRSFLHSFCVRNGNNSYSSATTLHKPTFTRTAFTPTNMSCIKFFGNSRDPDKTISQWCPG